MGRGQLRYKKQRDQVKGLYSSLGKFNQIENQRRSLGLRLCVYNMYFQEEWEKLEMRIWKYNYQVGLVIGSVGVRKG